MSLRSLKRHVSGRGESSGSSSPVNNDTYLATSAMSIKHLFDILDDEEGWDPTISSFTSVELFSKTLQPGDTISCIKAKVSALTLLVVAYVVNCVGTGESSS